MKNAINWFEIPVSNFDRAQVFYETILDTKLQIMEAMGMKSGFLPADMKEGGIGGCIIQGQGYEPSEKGTVAYLNGGEDLSAVLNKVEAAGGKVLMQKMGIGENGFMAHFLDSEGNKLGLHSMH